MRPGTLVFFCCAFSWLVCAIFLLAFSFDTLQPRDMALKFNDNTMYLHSNKLYNQNEGDSGRYFVGIGQHFIEFPRGLVSVKFNPESDADGPTISAKTFNGTTVFLDCAFQFGLKRSVEDVTGLYMSYGHNYKSFFIKYARQIVRDVVSDHLVFDLWEKRTEMGLAMQAALDAKLQARHAYVANFQVLSLSIPSDIQDAIETTSVAFQNIGKAVFEKEAETVRALTRRLVAEKSAEVVVLNADATASVTLTEVNATAEARAYTFQQEANAFSHVKQTFNFTNGELLKYAWLDAVVENTAANVLLSVQQPSVTTLP